MSKPKEPSSQQTNQQFSVVGLQLFKECNPHIKKNLNDGYYLFNEWCEVEDGKIQLSSKQRKPEQNFFGKNINIQAIVGKNGSGKSSILELMYRMINNFTFHLVEGQNREAAESICYIKDLHAGLYFVKGNTLGSLICRGSSIVFCFGKKKLSFNQQDPKTLDPAKLIEITEMFFYSIVTNYSLQSFIDIDYEIESDAGEIWINSLFHKNDGYLTPIVLNPYRNNGTIDAKKEYYLTNARLASILIESKRNEKQFIKGYQLHEISYEYNALRVLKKFDSIKSVDDFIKKSEHKRSAASVILKEYKLEFSSEESYNIACIYLIYKTLSIASKYPSFSVFKQFDDVNVFEEIEHKSTEELLVKLVPKIDADKSHITLKIRQTKNFIKNKRPLDLKLKFTDEEYIDKDLKAFDEITEHLPPPFFTFKIKLDKIKEDNKKEKMAPILFQQMSSGERQFIYTMSTFVYHIKNILSVQEEDRVKYRNVNLILDEVELCFHPEYQRRFIDDLIQTIKRLELNVECSFNIIIATHSPFVLSDIPISNILHLKNGIAQTDKKEFKNPFGANINDILYQSFFLDNGFIGEYARKKILETIDLLNKPLKSILDKKNNIKELISFIGEPLLQNELRLLYNEKFNEEDEKDIEIEKLKEKLALYEKNTD